uniref:PHR domain-containing protein n=1 Tax=Ditylenchus dipsaci TaxID=166011 RepID=A0A915E249_9BILA
MSINRFQRIEASWGYSGTPDRIKFTVDAPIFVLGFGLYGSMNDSAEYGVTIEIINFGSGQILAHRETSFMADGTPRIFRVMFKEPVEIASGLTYIASAKLKGAESHYGTKGLRRIVRQLAQHRVVYPQAVGQTQPSHSSSASLPEITTALLWKTAKYLK